MKKYNKYKCSKNPKGNLNACLGCWEYKKGLCNPVELNILRQTDTGYELYYPLQKLLRKVVRVLCISTKEVLEELKRKYKIKIARPTLLKYHKMGLINQNEKIGRGKSKGVVTTWPKNTARKFNSIFNLKDKGIKLEEFKKYQDILAIKYPELLLKYRGFPLNVMILGKSSDAADIIKFFTVAATIAAVELDIGNPSNYGSKVIIDEVDAKKSKVEITFINEANAKRVVFSKEGAKVIEAT